MVAIDELALDLECTRRLAAERLEWMREMAQVNRNLAWFAVRAALVLRRKNRQAAKRRNTRRRRWPLLARNLWRAVSSGHANAGPLVRLGPGGDYVYDLE